MLGGCQTSPIAPPKPPQQSSADIIQKLHALTTEFMHQADTLERSALRMYYAIRSLDDDVSETDCNFVADEKNRALPIQVATQLKILRETKALMGLPEGHDEFIRYRDTRNAMEWTYYQLASTHNYCQ